MNKRLAALLLVLLVFTGVIVAYHPAVSYAKSNRARMLNTITPVTTCTLTGLQEYNCQETAWAAYGAYWDALETPYQACKQTATTTPRGQATCYVSYQLTAEAQRPTRMAAYETADSRCRQTAAACQPTCDPRQDCHYLYHLPVILKNP